VREHFAGEVLSEPSDWDIAAIKLSTLRAALTTFPRARKMGLGYYSPDYGPEPKEALLQWLREGGRGRHLEVLRLESRDASDLATRRCEKVPSPRSRGWTPDGGLPRRHARAAREPQERRQP
jgi:hypothetical protein